MKNLVIVESPAKAKTIEKYLGKDFTVMSSIGHIRQISLKDKNAIDTENGFKTKYEVDPEKKKVVSELKKAVKQAGAVWLATDEDREGEAIAWHLCEVLGLDPKTTKRIAFHEITKSALEEAVKNPRTVDMNLVHAQQTRQILDRLVGFELSPVVWQKVPGGKSAGRVQSPALKLIVEKEREIQDFKPETSFKVSAIFSSDSKNEIKATLNKSFNSTTDTKEFLQEIANSKFTVSDVSQSPATRNPSAPFTTSTLQQEASHKLGYSAKTTMSSAQRLYQSGKITYMRTDSVSLSKQALAQTADYIKKTFGEEYLTVRNFKNKNSSAQEAHEAIRPTDISLSKASTSQYDQKLYKLILNRTLASQMAPAKIEKTKATIDISNRQERFEAEGEVVIFDGFLKVVGLPKYTTLPKLSTGDELTYQVITAKESFSKAPARYTEGSLVKKLEELGIGRPSTYATILNTIQDRGYVIKGEGETKERQVTQVELINGDISETQEVESYGSDKGKLIPNPNGEMLSDFLNDYFNQIVDYGFTAKLEEDFDNIAHNIKDRVEVLREFYTPFHKLVEKSGEIDRSKVAKAREVGIDPKTKKPILARIGRFGPMLQLGLTEDKEDKPRFAPLPKNRTVNDVTLEEAIEMFKLPRNVGKTKDGKDITANIGRFGPYIQVDKLFVSIKSLDPLTITLDEAQVLYDEKLEAEAKKNIKIFDNGIKIINGPYGPYLTDGRKNVKLAKDTDFAAMTEADAKKMIDEAPAKKPFKRKRKSSKK